MSTKNLILNPLMPCPAEFEDFVFLLQAMLHDQGVFRPTKMSKLCATLPPNNHHIESRTRYIFFCDEICMVIDQDVHEGFKPDGTFTPDTSRLISLIHMMPYILTSQSSIMIAHKSVIEHENFMEGKSGARDFIARRKGFESHHEMISFGNNLIIDLPFNLNLVTDNPNDSRSGIGLLIQILNHHIRSLKRKFASQTIREISDEEHQLHARVFKDEAQEKLCELDSNGATVKEIEPCRQYQLHFTYSDHSHVLIDINFLYTYLTMRIPKNSHWPIHEHSGWLFLNKYLGGPLEPSQFHSIDDMLALADIKLAFIQILHKDLQTIKKLLESCLGEEWKRYVQKTASYPGFQIPHWKSIIVMFTDIPEKN